MTRALPKIQDYAIIFRIGDDFGSVSDFSFSEFQYVRFFVDVGSVFDLKLLRCPRLVAPTLVTLPSMSLIPFAPFSFSVFQFSERAVFERFILQPDLNPLGAENETGRAERPTSWEARSQDVGVEFVAPR